MIPLFKWLSHYGLLLKYPLTLVEAPHLLHHYFLLQTQKTQKQPSYSLFSSFSFSFFFFFSSFLAGYGFFFENPSRNPWWFSYGRRDPSNHRGAAHGGVGGRRQRDQSDFDTTPAGSGPLEGILARPTLDPCYESGSLFPSVLANAQLPPTGWEWLVKREDATANAIWVPPFQEILDLKIQRKDILVVPLKFDFQCLRTSS